jgi:hypothetical protein
MRRIVVGAVAGASALLGSPGAAWGDHGHYVVREDRNGETHCRYIADGQTRKASDEPGGHQFHDHVHPGRPGTESHGTDFDKAAVEDDRCDHVNENGNP